MDSQPEIEAGKRLVRLADKGLSLGERLANQFYRLTWRTPLHTMRLKGRYPLKLLAVPTDPLPGNRQAGQWMKSGQLRWRGEAVPLGAVTFGEDGVSPGLADHLQRFEWLRDLAALGDRAGAAPIAEKLMRAWLARHGETVTDPAWRPDLVGWRTLFWAAHAPLILSSTDLVYRSAVLNALARGGRHLDRGADRAPLGVPRIAAWAGVVAAGLLVPGGELRRSFGEAGLARTLLAGLSDDGGVLSRSPVDQGELVTLLAMLGQVYDARREAPPAFLTDTQGRAVAALLGVAMGGALSSWQGSGPLPAGYVGRVVDASGVRTRPLRQARDWGYQRLSSGSATIIVDAAPPPSTRIGGGGCASTLAFELSDGDQRVIVNCGGARGVGTLDPHLTEGLRTTAAHSTLVIAESNSTAINPDGTLGAGVRAVELDRHELETGSRIDASHDGYARRFGFVHKRSLALSATGRELHGEDALLPSRRRRRSTASDFAIRFHLAPGVEVTLTADGQGALLRVDRGPLWQFRCKGGAIHVEDSLWVDGEGKPCATSQFVVTGQSPAGGVSINWLLKRAG